MAGCVWCYLNHEMIESKLNFSNTKIQTEQQFAKEKTIKSFNNSKRANQEQLQDALDNEY